MKLKSTLRKYWDDMATKKRMSKGAAAKSIAKREHISVKNAAGILAWANATKNGTIKAKGKGKKGA